GWAVGDHDPGGGSLLRGPSAKATARCPAPRRVGPGAAGKTGAPRPDARTGTTPASAPPTGAPATARRPQPVRRRRQPVRVRPHRGEPGAVARPRPVDVLRGAPPRAGP